MNKTTTPTLAYAGVDISKDALDVSLVGRSPERYDNNAAGIAGLIWVLARMPGAVHVICEPSGETAKQGQTLGFGVDAVFWVRRICLWPAC